MREEYQSAEEYRDVERAAKQWNSGRGSLLMKLDLAVALNWRKTERPNKDWATRYGDAFPLTMAFIQKSKGSRLRRRTIAFGIPIIALFVVSSLLTYLATFFSVALPYIVSGEFNDYYVKPQAVLHNGSPGMATPKMVPGGRVIVTLALKAALKTGTIGGAPFKLIDAWDEDSHTSIPHAIRIPYAGHGGNFQDDTEHKLETELKKLTQGKRDMPLVFFCTGSQCWESYNASLRAIYLGYTNVHWYRGGLNTWSNVNSALDLKSVELSKIKITLSEVWSNAPDVLRSAFEPTIINDDGQSNEADPQDTNSLSASEYTKRGITEMNKADYDDAIIDYTRAITLDPKNTGAYYNRGVGYARKDDNDDAIADFTKAIGLGFNNPSVFASRGDVYVTTKDYPHAIQDYSRAIQLDPKSATYLSKRGNTYYATTDYPHAIQDYGRAIQLGPKSVIFLHNWRGNAYYAAGDYDRAIQDYSQAIQLDPKSAIYLGKRGNAYAAKGDYDNAIKDFDKALKLNPGSAEVHFSEGFVSAHKGDYDKAIKDYSQAIKLSPLYANAYYGRGGAYLAKRDYEHAGQDYDEAIRNNPDYAEAFFGRGRAYFAKRDYDHAVQDFSKTIALQPGNADAYWYRARAELYWDKPGSAADDLAAAVKLAPDHAYMAIWLHIARMRAGENDASELAANAQKLDKAKWPWPIMALFLGSATPEAVRISSQSADDPTTRKDQLCEADFYLGVYHGAKGEENDARQLFQAAANSCPREYVEYETAGLELDRLH